MLTIKKILQEAILALRKQNIDHSPRESRILLAFTIGKSPEYVFGHPEQSVSEEHYQLFLEYIVRRSQGEPLSRIMGEREFWGLSFLLSQDTLDPRADSETVIEAALKHKPKVEQPLHLLDFGTGSGCLLLSLLKEIPDAIGIGVDISLNALQTAQKNAFFHHLNDRAFFINSHWGHALQGTFDIILSNPPYISEEDFKNLKDNVRHFDPYRALVSGMDGLECYRALAQDCSRLLSPQGILVLEIGENQEIDVIHIFKSNYFKYVTTYRDLASIPRALVFNLQN
jgi:release factor glutamine methyltransferase